MVVSRPDWCLSRQRYWGVPIPAIICNECKEELLEADVILNFAKFVSMEGSDSWFIREVNDFLPPGFTCPHCKAGSFSKGSDILDVWFDSGVSHQAVLKKRADLEFPCALYLEGSDQHRGWFQSSLIPGVCIDGIPPFKAVLTHGHVVDGEGRKMSKSLGNVIAPQEIIKDYGVDILRLWVAASDYNEDIRISAVILSRLAEAYRKVRNTARFILSNLYDFSPDKDRVAYQDLKPIDKWILFKLQAMLKEVEQAYEEFEFYKAYKLIYDFCNEDLSMYYLDMAKGRLYTCAASSKERRAAQTAIYESLHVLARVMAPVLPFSADEIWQNITRAEESSSTLSVHLARWPQVNPEFAQSGGCELNEAIGLISSVTMALEEKRSAGVIGSSFDAKIKLLTNNEKRYKYLDSLRSDLCEIFKVSSVEIVNSSGQGGFEGPVEKEVTIEVGKAEGVKCARCWNFSMGVGNDRDHPLICDKCASAIGGV
jgi:isoleucyl-tRNA synthetase